MTPKFEGLTVSVCVCLSQAAVLLEHERQQELAKVQQGAAPGPRGPELGPRPNLLPPIPPLRGQPPHRVYTGEKYGKTDSP